MKAFGLALLCLVAAVQGRSADVESLSTPAQSGENPWIVHLRVASSNANGLLRTCVGTIVSNSWVLTTASCVSFNRFIWVRYGALDVVFPEMVSETNNVRPHPQFNATTRINDIALVNLNRVLENTENIRPVSLAASDADLPDSGRVCSYGLRGNAPGERLVCFSADLSEGAGNTIVASSTEGSATQFDSGAPLVSDGVQYGVLQSAVDDRTVFLSTAAYRDWINSIIG